MTFYDEKVIGYYMYDSRRHRSVYIPSFPYTFSILRTKNEFLFRFSFSNLRTKNEFVFHFPYFTFENEKRKRNSFFCVKFENEKGKDGIYTDRHAHHEVSLNSTILRQLLTQLEGRQDGVG